MSWKYIPFLVTFYCLLFPFMSPISVLILLTFYNICRKSRMNREFGELNPFFYVFPFQSPLIHIPILFTLNSIFGYLISHFRYLIRVFEPFPFITPLKPFHMPLYSLYITFLSPFSAPKMYRCRMFTWFLSSLINKKCSFYYYN